MVAWNENEMPVSSSTVFVSGCGLSPTGKAKRYLLLRSLKEEKAGFLEGKKHSQN